MGLLQYYCFLKLKEFKEVKRSADNISQLLILSKAVEPLAKLSWEELSRGLTGLTVILAEVVAVTKLMGNPYDLTGIGRYFAAVNIFL